MESRDRIRYDDLKKMRESSVETDEQGRLTPYSEQLQYYCDSAIDYIDLVKEHVPPVDMSANGLSNLPLAVVLLHRDNIAVGMTHDASFEHIKRQVAGYVLFSLYNASLDDGYQVSIRLNDEGSGLDLLVSDGYEEETIDVIGRISNAFDLLDIEWDEDSLHIECKLDEFCDTLIGDTWGAIP